MTTLFREGAVGSASSATEVVAGPPSTLTMTSDSSGHEDAPASGAQVVDLSLGSISASQFTVGKNLGASVSTATQKAACKRSTVADTIALTLLAHGITKVFGQSLPSALLLATERRGIEQVSCRAENAGGAMADAYARTSNCIGVIGAQNGPAATLLVPPLDEVLKASIPILALVQQVPTGARDNNAFHNALFGGVAKSVNTLTDPARAQEYVEAMLRTATTGRPGPVVLLLPSDVLVAEAPEFRTPLRSLGTFPLDRTRPASESIEAAADAIATAARPVIVAGGGVHLSDTVDELYQEEFGEESQGFDHMRSDAAWLLFNTLCEGGGTDPEAIKEAAAKIDLPERTLLSGDGVKFARRARTCASPGSSASGRTASSCPCRRKTWRSEDRS